MTADLDTLRAERDAAVARAERAERLLIELTIGGSEFVGNPQRCYEWVRDTMSSNLRQAITASGERNQALAELSTTTARAETAEAAYKQEYDTWGKRNVSLHEELAATRERGQALATALNIVLENLTDMHDDNCMCRDGSPLDPEHCASCLTVLESNGYEWLKAWNDAETERLVERGMKVFEKVRARLAPKDAAEAQGDAQGVGES
jgi:hypothetical protein